MIYLENARIPTEKAHGLQIMKMVEAFQGQGVDVELVVAKRANNQLEHEDPFNYYGLKKRFKIKKLPLIDLVDLGLSIKGLSVPLQNTSFAISAFFSLLFSKADIIYSRDEFSLFLLSFFKKNLVFELHTFTESKKLYKMILFKFLFRRVKKIVVITKGLQGLLENQLGVSQDKIVVSADAVDLKQFVISKTRKECRDQLGLPLDKNIILYTGHLFGWKGVNRLVESSSYLADNDLIVIVGGMEHDQKKLNKFISEKNLRNILIVGYKPPKDIPVYLKAADILVLPNSGKNKISEHYTSPMKMFEYMAANKPIVASDIPSIKEVLNSDNAVLVAPDDSSALADGIKNILSNEELAEKVSQNAYTTVQDYTWDKRAKKVLNFIS
jgi:glycosyltransferase involved in cell wall biosynthesis